MVLHLLIIGFCINVYCSKGEKENAFITRNNYTWAEAKNNCTMIGQENHVNISSSIDRELWTDATVTYSPWIEYLGTFECIVFNITVTLSGCSRVTNEIAGAPEYVTSGQQIKECLYLCTEYDSIGLQQGRCACLQRLPPNNGDSDPDCESKRCDNDDNGLCVDANDSGMYAVYSKPVFSRNDIRAGNCLSVVRNDIGGKGVNSYEAIPCDRHLLLVCLTGHNLHTSGTDKYVWSQSFRCCSNGTLARYSVVLNQTIQLKLSEHYWLANIRRPTFHFYSDPEPEPKYCVSAKISSNGKLMKSVEKCDKRLPALCLDRQEYVINPDKDNTGLNVSITVVVLLVGSVVLAVFIVVTVWRVRLKKKQLSLDQPHNTSEDGHEYTEINETAECSIQPPERVNEQFTYDHLSHSQKVTSNPPGNIYDTTTDLPARYYDQSSTVKSSYDKINISKNTHGNFQNQPPNEYDSVRLIEKCDEDKYHHLDRNKGNVTTNFGNDYIDTSFVN
ncbi:unnamed protein product [Mytilus coruscus]|uniref:WSC domain-containing protein n=1 Tax=Mytilus coruscus TaxID=42192 RepID=A0A6J8BQE8_MYTCO|nr:unnamed protein product [Mytilus coruscus]